MTCASSPNLLSVLIIHLSFVFVKHFTKNKAILHAKHHFLETKKNALRFRRAISEGYVFLLSVVLCPEPDALDHKARAVHSGFLSLIVNHIKLALLGSNLDSDAPALGELLPSAPLARASVNFLSVCHYPAVLMMLSTSVAMLQATLIERQIIKAMSSFDFSIQASVKKRFNARRENFPPPFLLLD